MALAPAKMDGSPSWTISRNGLNGEIPPELSNLAGLNVLDLSGNQLGGPIPPELGGLANLTYARP